jgi:hypothetical protein
MEITSSGKNFFNIRWVKIDGEMYLNKEDVINSLMSYNKHKTREFQED